MYTAVYYPFKSVQSKKLLKLALLLWDRLEYIIPGYGDEWMERSDTEEAEALNLVGHGVVPDGQQQQLAHDMIAEMLTSPACKSALLKAEGKSKVTIFPGKFKENTRYLLAEHGLGVAAEFDSKGYWTPSKPLGLIMMAMLAEACAGSQKRMVTDQASSYKTLTTSILHIHEGPPENVSVPMEQLVSVALKTVDADQFTIQQLIEFRRDANGPQAHQYRELRHRFLGRVDHYASKIAKCSQESDIDELERLYKQEMEDDLANLKDALKDTRTTALIQVGIDTLIAGASLVLPEGSSKLGVCKRIGSLVNTSKAYSKERRAELRKHPMSWLFELKQHQDKVKPL